MLRGTVFVRAGALLDACAREARSFRNARHFRGERRQEEILWALNEIYANTLPGFEVL